MAVTVARGDTLKKIAAANGITLAQLLALNPDITNPDLIQVNQQINVESARTDVGDGDIAKSEPSAEESAAENYTVVRGDTLGQIAAANGITLAELLKLNPGITNPDLIHPGDVIVISAGGDGEPPEPEEEEDPAPGLLAGGETIKVTVDGQDRYYQIYEFPAGSGQYVSYQFNDLNALGAATGDRSPAHTIRSESWFDRNVVAEAPAEQIIGLPGTWQGFSQEIIKDEAALLGINDPSLLGLFASDPEMQAIAAKAAIGDWSATEVRAAQRQTDFWKNTLYPGIENFYSQTTDPELAWANYVRNVDGSLVSLGYERDADGTYNSTIENMLDRGISDTAFNIMAPTFVQAQNSEQYMSTLQQWAARDGISMDFGDFFDLMDGNAVPEVQAIAEKAMLQWRADNAGVGVTGAQIENIAGASQLSQAQADQAFADFNRTIAAVGDLGLAKYNVTANEFLLASTGVDPGEGRNIEDLKLLGAKIAQENALFDDEKINFYVGYNPRGVPVRQGLAALRPEAG